MQAPHERPVEPQLMAGAQHAAVIPADVEALAEGDTRSAGIPAVPDRDLGTAAPEDPPRRGQHQRTAGLPARTQEDLHGAGLQRERHVHRGPA